MSQIIQKINEKVVKQIYDFIDPEIVILDKETYNELVSYYKNLPAKEQKDSINDILKINVHGFMLEVFVSRDTTERIEVYGKRHKIDG